MAELSAELTTLKDVHIKAITKASKKNLKEGDIQDILREALVATAQMKDWQRRAHAEVARRTQTVNKKRSLVDSARLAMDNLAYKRAHLLREIKSSKDLETPEIGAICAETGLEQLNMSVCEYMRADDDIDSWAKGVCDKLDEEELARKNLQATLKAQHDDNARSLAISDKRRKVLEDIRLKFLVVKAAAADLQRALGTE